jgi:hypothetical protein
VCVFLVGRKGFKRIITRGVGLRGTSSRPTNCLQYSPRFRPQLPLPVIGLTTWLYRLFWDERVGARSWEMLKQVQHDVLWWELAVSVIVRSKTCATRFYDETICLFGGLLLRTDRPACRRQVAVLQNSTTFILCLAMTPRVGFASIDRQYSDYRARILLAGLSATVEVKRWVTKVLKLFSALRLRGLIH